MRGMKHGAKAENPKKTLKRLFDMVFRKHKVKLLIVLLCVLSTAYATSYSSTVMQSFIDDYMLPMVGVENPDFLPFILALSRFGVIMLCFMVIPSFLIQRIMVYMSQGSILEIRNRMFEKLESLPISYFDTHQSGDTMSRFSNDTDTLNQMISQSLVQMLSATLTTIFILFSMVRNSWILTLCVLLFIFLMFKVIGHIGKKSGSYFTKQQMALGKVNGFIEEMMAGTRVIKVFTHEEESKKDFDLLNDSLMEAMGKANSYSNAMGPVSMNMGNLQYVFLVLVGSVIAILSGGAYTVGALAAFLLLSRSLSNNVSNVAQQANSVLVALAGAERIFELLDEEAEKDDGYVTLCQVKEVDGNLVETEERTHLWAWKHPHTDGSGTTYKRLEGDIVLKDVDFGYVEDRIVLHDISLYAKPGQKIAFVGSTGAGKTTITNLLTRFYDIQDGKIRFDGININKIRKADLRRAIGLILQDTNLFTGTIRENIRYGRMDASDEEVEMAARLANAHDFIMKMPNGYDTVIENNGEGLSQGQRQLLSIARAAVKDPPVMIMDEATSSIDTHTETLVQSGMDKIMEGRTVFVIAHRLSTVRNSNAIMVLEKGRIIERGDHDDLISQKGTYYQLYTGSSELE